MQIALKMIQSCPSWQDEWFILLACNGLYNESRVILMGDMQET